MSSAFRTSSSMRDRGAFRVAQFENFVGLRSEGRLWSGGVGSLLVFLISVRTGGGGIGRCSGIVSCLQPL